jgi:hypothetical protein
MDFVRTESIDARFALENADLPESLHPMNRAVPDTLRDLNAMLEAEMKCAQQPMPTGLSVKFAKGAIVPRPNKI